MKKRVKSLMIGTRTKIYFFSINDIFEDHETILMKQKRTRNEKNNKKFRTRKLKV